jgi:hypothetical protein
LMYTIDTDSPCLNRWGTINLGMGSTTETLYPLVRTTILSILKMDEK